jgi:pimeloyl-ACP methyl ester carboxylesterase
VPRPSRRAVLIGGGLGLLLAAGGTSYELIQAGTLPGKYALADLDGACGSAPPPPRGALPARHAVSFYSRYRHRQVQLVTLIPAGAADPGRGAAGASRGPAAGALRVLIALHGSGSDAAAMARRVAPAMTAARLTGVAVLCVDGGGTYWHKRADGDDPVGMIVHEVLPRAAAAGLATARVALLGESMGGYGALLLAERFATAARRSGMPAAAAAAALSPAIFGSYADAVAANHASFDSMADFRAHDVLADAAALRDVPTWIAGGSDDPFEPETADLRARLAELTGHPVAGGILAGCHDDAFWDRNMPAALRFAAAHLASPARATDVG